MHVLNVGTGKCTLRTTVNGEASSDHFALGDTGTSRHIDPRSSGVTDPFPFDSFPTNCFGNIFPTYYVQGNPSSPDTNITFFSTGATQIQYVSASTNLMVHASDSLYSLSL